MDFLRRSAFILVAAAILLLSVASAQVPTLELFREPAIQDEGQQQQAFIDARGPEDTTTKKSRFLFEFSAEYDPPTLTWVPPNMNFTCTGKAPGYYSDPAYKCQVYHLCLPDGRRYSMLCGIGTVFNQRTFVCDHWYAYPCSNAERDYQLNDQLWEQVLLPGSSSSKAGAPSQQGIGDDGQSDEQDY